jgi:hypothetical protein
MDLSPLRGSVTGDGLGLPRGERATRLVDFEN